MMGVVLLVISSFILKHGFYLSNETRILLHQLGLLIVGVFIGEFLLKLLLSQKKKIYLKENRIAFFLIIFFSFSIFLLKNPTSPSGFIYSLDRIGILAWPGNSIIIFEIYVLTCLLLRIPQLNKAITVLKIKPPWIVILTFVSIIAVGTLLLLLPRATAPGKETMFMDALFTATSATCVTGLVVLDTGSHFSLLGQLIILSLIQVGGLGLMTFTSFFVLTLGKEFGVKDRTVLRDILNYRSIGRIGSLVVSILIITFTIEIVGAIFLYIQFLPYNGGGLSSAYSAIFHSISAFCNAGFSLYSDSFIKYRNDLGINLTMSSLIILGGLGFIVIVNLLHWAYGYFRHKKEPLSLQSKLVLVVSSLLIIGGTALIFLAEKNGVLSGFSWKEKLLTAYFQSVTARTAGFNTLNIGSVGIFSAFLFIIFMFIGASPGSTGGGIKTSTFATLFLTIRSMTQGKNRVEVFHRTIPPLVVYQALCVAILALGWIASSTLVLSLTESAPFIDIFFEELSAFGTVGLSRGLTSQLTTAGRVVIMLSVLVGRIGPLTLALAMGRGKMKELYQYPEERIMVG
ncbi:hypothetical protein ES702_07811 [subsurface metagenome]